ncbi:hypothetical protein [Streptacidiphilus sp. PAMC 29251]
MFLTLAVASIVITTGSGPQEKVITPPAATAATTAAEVQLPGVPWPTVRVGCVLSTACAAVGTAAPPPGFPAFGSGGTRFFADGTAVGFAEALGRAVLVLGPGVDATADPTTPPSPAGPEPATATDGVPPDPQPARSRLDTTPAATTTAPRMDDIARC